MCLFRKRLLLPNNTFHGTSFDSGSENEKHSEIYILDGTQN